MSRTNSNVLTRAAIALATVVSAIAAFVALAPDGDIDREAAPGPQELRSSADSPSAESTGDATSRTESPPAPGALAEAGDDAPPTARSGTRPLAREREIRAAFRERQQAEPGWLEREAANLLGAGRSDADRVALLRALEDCRSAEYVTWLEHAVRNCPDVASAQGVSTPTFALARLRQVAPADVEAREALLRLAFEAPGLSATLRSTAAAAAAAVATVQELPALERSLRAQREPQLLESAIASLGARSSEASIAALLSRNGWSPPARHEPAAETVIE